MGGYRSYLRSMGWEESKETLFILDEAQASYQDSALWIGLFKSLHGYPYRRAIVFANYGSPSSRFTISTATPIGLTDFQRVTLHHIDHEDGLPPVGLLLSRVEFNEFIPKVYPEHHFFS
jgi:hypothetical protein